MLSFLYRLVRLYYREHGLHPNLLYLSPQHYQRLLECLPQMTDQEQVSRFLMMQIVISPEAVHPHVAWSPGGAGAEPVRPGQRMF